MEAAGILEGQETETVETENNEDIIIASNEKDVQTDTGIEAPENLSNKELWDKDRGSLKTDRVIEELSKADKRISDLRQKLSKGTDVPKTADDYTFTARESIADIVDTGTDIFKEVKAIAHKNGLTNTQFESFLNDYMEMSLEKGVIKKPLTAQEQKVQKESFVADQKRQLGANADGLIKSAVSFINAEYQKGVFDESEKKALLILADSGATGIKILNKFREMSGQPFMPMDNSGVDSLPSDREILSEWGEKSDSEKTKILEQRIKLGRPTKFMKS